MERNVDVAIIGAGTSGLSALSRVRRKTDSFVLINGGELGTTCARVGCMPSKAAIQVAEDFHRRHLFDRFGIEGMESLSMDVAEAMEHVRDLRDMFVDRVLAGSTDELGDEFVEGYARFVEPTVLDVQGETIRAKRIIIATGSRPIVPEAWAGFRDRVLTTDDLFEQEQLPQSMAVVGLGVIGLEMGQALHRMGVAVTGIDQRERIAGLTDPVANQVAVETLGQEFPMWLGHGAEIEPRGDGRLSVRSGDNNVVVDKVLASMGRTPNLERLGLETLGVKLNARGVPEHDPQTMQIGDLPVFIAGDVTADRPILHEAGDDGRIAGYNAVAERVTAFKRKTPLAITFCEPNIVTAGATWDQLDSDRVAVGEMRLGPVGRALIMGKNKGILRLYAERTDGRLLGAALVASKGEHLGHLLAWCIEQRLTVLDLLRMPFYHPTVEEALQAALYDLLGKLDIERGEMVELQTL
jgi:dihydrolipoamide dehydrogenase